MRTRQMVAVAVWVTLGVLPVCAQTVISARSGLIHYVEGRVYLNDKAVETKFANFSEVKESQVLRSEQGRAEVLLGPGIFLRMAENSSFRMISSRLIDTRLEHLGGSILIECVDIPKDTAVTVVDRNATISLLKKGLYRFDSDPAQARVYEGEALVESAGQRIELKKGKLISLDGDLVASKFDPKTTDALFRWSERRAQGISLANVSAAKGLLDSGYTWGASGWRWNPYFGMFTFIPGNGSFYSPFGYRYYSPRAVHHVYAPPPVINWSAADRGSSIGYAAVPATSSGTSGTVAASGGASTAASQSSSAPISRGSGSAGGSHR
jgi:hypothetical protein